jgi:hypothetical protein
VKSTAKIPWSRVLPESAVIIASILIAFAIDSWWADRQEDIRRNELILELQSDLTATLEDLDVAIPAVEKRLSQMFVYFRGISTIDSVPLADVRSGFLAALDMQDFNATTSSYDSAIASGDIRLVPNVDFKLAMSDFVRSQSILVAIDRTYNDTLTGPTWDIFRQIGDWRILLYEPSAVPDSDPISKKFEMSESDLREFFSQPDTVAMTRHMEIIKRNQLNFLGELRTSTLEAISALETK